MKPNAARVTGFCFLVAFAIVVYCLLSGYGFSGQIRLDTGDLRYCFLGVPYLYEPMPEPDRSALLSIAKESDLLKPAWHTCVRYPLPTTNNPDLMCRTFYAYAAAWARADGDLGKLALEDLATYIQKTGAQYGLPDSCLIFSAFLLERDDNGNLRAVDAWRDHERVRCYCEKKGYDLDGDSRRGQRARQSAAETRAEPVDRRP